MSSKTTIVKALNAKFKDQKGMTLVDLSIAMVLLGILITPVLYQLKEMKYQETINQGNEKMTIVEDAIERYFLANGFYPCPANPALPRNDANHGVSAMGAGTTCALTTGAGLVAEGSIPHTELGISIDDTYDGYKNKIAYAVTDSLASSIAAGTPPAPTNGQITINEIPLVPEPTAFGAANAGDDICANTIATYPPSPLPFGALATDYPPVADWDSTDIHYTLFSYGTDGVGAFNAQGTQIAACVDDGATGNENCDLALNDAAVALYQTQQCRESNTNGLNYYDDMMISGAIEDAKKGIPNSVFSSIIGIDGDIQTNVQLIGVNNPAAAFPLDIIGNLKSTSDITDSTLTGVAKSAAYCNDAGECFTSSVIGGSDPNMQCANGSAFEGIANNSATCEKKITGLPVATTCPAGQFIRTIDLTGTGTALCGP